MSFEWRRIMKIAFIAVNYNNWHISANYISTVKALNHYDQHDITIIIVDNSFQDEDYSFPAVTVTKRQA